MDPFVYRDGDEVPRDATRVVVHPSVRVLPRGAFSGRERLEEVRLPEGLAAIGDEAFYNCRSLRRLACPSTVVRIGDFAFKLCRKLEEVRLNDGLEEIGDRVFCNCYALRRLDCPPTVVRIGDRVLVACRRLSAVRLAGIVKVERDAFAWCGALERIGIPPRALVVRRGADRRDYTRRLVTDGTIANTHDEFVLIAPACLTTLPESNLAELGNSVRTIMSGGEGTEEERLGRVRREVHKEVRGEVSAILGLAFWKAKIDEAEKVGIGAARGYKKNAEGGRKRAMVGIVLTWEAREGCRGAGKGKLIAENVLPFLDGLWGNGCRFGRISRRNRYEDCRSWSISRTENHNILIERADLRRGPILPNS